jgi:hypothetical protein
MKRFRSWTITVIVVGLLAAAAPKLMWLVEQNKYARQKRVADQLFENLRARRPPDCPADKWRHAATWSSIAFGNIFFSPEHASYSELRKFTAELRSMLERDVNVELFDWIWDRLEVTGIHGNRYVDRFRSAYEEPLRDFSDSDGVSGEPRPGALGIVPPLLSSRDELDRHLDRLVAIRGIVSPTKIPTIIGVDVRDPHDELRDKEAYAVGILRKWTETQEGIDARTRKYGVFAHRGPGDFYALYFDLSGELAEARPWPPPTPDASESK